MGERARSTADKQQRSEEMLEAAEALAVELGGVRFVTVAAVTKRVGLHRTGVRRYYASREELLLELAERGWRQWRDEVRTALGKRTNLGPRELAKVIGDTIAALPVFCDLLTHATLYLEGDVALERARRYKDNSFGAHDEIVSALTEAGTMSAEQIETVLAAAAIFAAGLWQVSHPTPSLARLYEEVPRWAHAALSFAPRLHLLIESVAVGLAAAPPRNDS